MAADGDGGDVEEEYEYDDGDGRWMRGLRRRSRTRSAATDAVFSKVAASGSVRAGSAGRGRRSGKQEDETGSVTEAFPGDMETVDVDEGGRAQHGSVQFRAGVSMVTIATEEDAVEGIVASSASTWIIFQNYHLGSYRLTTKQKGKKKPKRNPRGRRRNKAAQFSSYRKLRRRKISWK